MYKIISIQGLEVLDSRGYPTVACKATVQNLNTSTCGTEYAMIPSGASRGKLEALELRDKNLPRFHGKGVLQAVANINEVIAKSVVNSSFNHQEEFDAAICQLDKTHNKSALGANAILGASLAFAKAAAASEELELYQYLTSLSSNNSAKTAAPKPRFYQWQPTANGQLMPIPFINVINGGAHADNKMAFQEFMLVPYGAKDFRHSLQISAEVFYRLKEILQTKGHNTNCGDEGGFAPLIDQPQMALDLLLEAINKAGYSINQFGIALDVAANHFYQDGYYNLLGKQYSTTQIIQYYSSLSMNYPIISLEDPIAEDDHNGWEEITTLLGAHTQIVGDDLFVTNHALLKNGAKNKMANSILIKPNQIGTLTETYQTIQTAAENQYSMIISHRSGDTEDTFIADLSVAVRGGQIKTGSLSRSERIAKYNRLLMIEG